MIFECDWLDNMLGYFVNFSDDPSNRKHWKQLYSSALFRENNASHPNKGNPPFFVGLGKSHIYFLQNSADFNSSWQTQISSKLCHKKLSQTCLFNFENFTRNLNYFFINGSIFQKIGKQSVSCNPQARKTNAVLIGDLSLVYCQFSFRLYR